MNFTEANPKGSGWCLQGVLASKSTPPARGRTDSEPVKMNQPGPAVGGLVSGGLRRNLSKSQNTAVAIAASMHAVSIPMAAESRRGGLV